MPPRVIVIAILALPTLALAQKQEIREMQRDISLLQDQVRTLKSSFDEKMGALSELMRQNVDATKDLQKAVTVLETRMNDRLAEQAKTMGAPVVTLGTKYDQMSQDFSRLVESVNDLVSRVGKLDQKVATLSVDVKNLQPAPPPPGQTPSAAGSGAPAPSAETLYENARRDMLGGKADLALQQFQDYVRLYNNTDRAPNAEYWIGQIYFDRGEFEKAVQAFDNVLTNYDENSKSADALLMKGRSLVKLGRRSEAIPVLRKVDAKSEAGPKACAELKALGVSCVPGTAAKKRQR